MAHMSDQLTIVHVVVSDKFAGVERYICTIAEQQVFAGHRVAVIGGDQDRMAHEMSGLPLLRRRGDNLVQAASALTKLSGSDIVHAHMTAGELVAAATLPRSGRLVVTRHFAQFRGSSTAGRAAGKFIAARTAAQIAISDFVAARVESGNTVVIRPGVPDRPDRRPPDEGNRVVLMVQRLEREKQTEVALELWAASGLAERGWQLHLAGDGAERTALERRAGELGIAQSCRFLGFRSDVPELLASAAIVLAPRHDEPYGLSVVEAMAAGTPVFAGAGGGHDETVGKSPYAALFPAGDPVSAGILLAELADDPARLERYGHSLQAIQRRYMSGSHQARKVVELYRTVIAS